MMDPAGPLPLSSPGRRSSSFALLGFRIASCRFTVRERHLLDVIEAERDGGSARSHTLWERNARVLSSTGEMPACLAQFRIRQTTMASQIIQARLKTQATTMAAECMDEKPWEPSTQPCTR